MAYRILIVDSQRERTRSLQRALAQLQHSFIITGVMSGEEGLLEARLNPVDLVISSTRLPGMDGRAFLEHIHSSQPNARCVLVGHEQAAGKDAGAGAADAYLSASSSENEIVKTAADLLGLDAAGIGGDPPVESLQPQAGIAEILTQLRRETGAETVLLLNDSGEILVRAGSLSNPDIETAVLPAMMAVFSAGGRISRFLGATGQPNHYLYRGKKTHLLMSATGQAWALVIGTQTGLHTTRLSAIQTAAAAAIREITATMADLGFPLTEELPAQVPPFITDLDEVDASMPVEPDPMLETLLETAPESLPEDADAFWEPGEESLNLDSLATDGLTYQQAIQLGLAPEDEDLA